MATQFLEGTVKLEDPSENVTEIQSYLAGFQKEIVDGNLQSSSSMSGFRLLYSNYHKVLKQIFCFHYFEN